MKTSFFSWVVGLVVAGGVAAGVGGCKKSGGGSGSTSPWTPGYSVYFAGNDGSRAAYWKNGVKTALDSGGVAGITLSGSSVYLGGIVTGKTDTGQSIRAAYWKDGVVTLLTASAYAWAYQPVVAGGDVYVPGLIKSGTDLDPVFDAVYWKNGQRVEAAPGVQAELDGMAVDGMDIYVIGDIHEPSSDTAVVWKNGQRLPGAGVSWPAYWKNGVLVKLPGFPGATAGIARGVVVAGSDVYVAGTLGGFGTGEAIYWKNGVLQTLTKSGGVYGVAVGN